MSKVMTRLSDFKLLLAISALIFLMPLTLPAISPGTTSSEILEKVFTVNKSIKSISLSMTMKERIGGDLCQKKTDFKVSFCPYKVYMKQSYPAQGLELLYLDGENNGKVLINRNTRTFSNFKLDPLGNTVRKGNHHSVMKAGYKFLLDVLQHLWIKYQKVGSEVWKYEGIVSYGGISCYKITMDNPDFRYVKYIINNGDNLESLSHKFDVCDYLIFERNPQIKSFDDIKPGTEILLPSDYAKQIVLYIDKELMVPVGVKAFDDKGLFEEYNYSNIKINPTFKEADFDCNNPSYGFR
jgi:outer membrane lipoprotein-sorting protein